MKDHMKDVANELMEAAEACVAEATPATLEPEKLTDPETRAAYWKHLYKEADAKLTLLQEKSEKLLLMVAKRDTKIEDLEILVEGHRESIREYKLELKQLETPINFDD